jgi:FkbM family methyltransferase
MKVTFSEHSYYTEHISETPVLLDLGSCLGDFSKHFLGRYDNARILLIEPSRNNFSRISNDPILDHVNIEKKFLALDSTSGKKLTFYEDPSSTQNGSLIFNYFNGTAYEIETVSLDDLVAKFDTVDLVKMDVEGAEWECLMNMSETTAKKIQQITVEFHDFLDPLYKAKTEDAVKRILDMGFKEEHFSTGYKHGSEYYDTLFYK